MPSIVIAVGVVVVAAALSTFAIWNVPDSNHIPDQNLTKSGFSMRTVLAQRTLIPTAVSMDSSAMVPLQLNIFEKDPMKDHTFHVGITAKGFHIFISGNYLVWINIEYAADKLCSQYDVQNWTLNLMVNRTTGSAQTSFNTWIAGSRDYICENENVPVRDTVHLKKIIKLMIFDVVYVRVTQAAPVTNKSSSNYAGLHLIN